MGVNVTEGEANRTDRLATYGDTRIVVEVKGSTKSAAERDAAQLEKWVSEYHVEHGVQPKGILVVNAWSNQKLPDRREPAFPPQMVPFAESRGHALVSGIQLLGAWLDVEADPDKHEEIVESLLACVGPWKRYTDWHEFLSTQQAELSEQPKDVDGNREPPGGIEPDS